MKHFHPELRESCHKHSKRKRTLKCEHCSKIYKRADFLAMHVTKSHKNFEKEKQSNETNEKRKECSNQAQGRGKKFQCEVCSKYYGSLNNLKSHMNIVHKKQNACRPCPICKQLSTKKNLRRHIRDVHERESFKCGSCNRCFSKEDKLNSHMKVAHNKKTNFKCKKCNFNFSSKHCLKDHIKHVHNKIKEHACAVCDRAFGNRFDLKIHANVHLKLKDFECHLCHQRFGYKRSLDRHMENKHGK